MKVLYVSTISNTINAFMIPHIEMLLDQGHHVDIACNIDREISPKLIDSGCKVFNVEFQRSPLKKENLSAFKKISKLIKNEKYDLVHTHTPIASAIVRLACKSNKKIKVFYTAHGFHFFKGAPIKNWLIYYTIEKWLSRYTDVLITINQEDFNRAKNCLLAKSVEYLPGVGLDIDKFNRLVVDRKSKRKEVGLPDNAFVVLSVGELNKNKNHETIIKAIAKLNNTNIHYVICGRGLLEDYLRCLVIELHLERQVHLLGFRNDVGEIYKISDIFAFPSQREGLGMAALEAMACGLPLITSNVHGIVDYSTDGKTGYTYNPKDIDGFASAISKLFTDRITIEKMCSENISLVKKYDINQVISKLNLIYNDSSKTKYP
ncbi:MAG: glycosyltransferase family 4 protein [Peptococcales bacterium]|jgi:glycosyltransferase involved in cell wall biosynthesis